MYAAVENRSNIIKRLIQAEAKIDATNHPGRTALIFAAENGSLRAVRQLIEANANLDIADKYGITALM